MASNEFLVSVANARIYDAPGGQLMAVAKTLVDTSIEVTLSTAEVRGGYGNTLLYTYSHTGALNLTLNDAQWNLGFLAMNVGQDITTGTNLYKEETVTLTGGGAGSVIGTPLAVTGSNVYGWVTLADGITTERVTFSTKSFTCSGSSGDKVCVRYYAYSSAAQQLIIPANIIPDTVYIELDTQLGGKDDSGASSIIGKVQIIIPQARLTGQFTISMAADNVSQTPMNAMAIATTETGGGCANTSIYAKIIVDKTNALWYQDVIALAFENAEIAIVHPATEQLRVWALYAGGLRAPKLLSSTEILDLTFASGTPATATVGAHTGLITTVGAGTTSIHGYLTSDITLDAFADVTVTT